MLLASNILHVFLTPPTLPGVPLVWFHVCPLGSYTLSSPAFKGVTSGMSFKHTCPPPCYPRYMCFKYSLSIFNWKVKNLHLMKGNFQYIKTKRLTDNIARQSCIGQAYKVVQTQSNSLPDPVEQCTGPSRTAYIIRVQQK